MPLGARECRSQPEPLVVSGKVEASVPLVLLAVSCKGTGGQGSVPEWLYEQGYNEIR